MTGGRSLRTIAAFALTFVIGLGSVLGDPGSVRAIGSPGSASLIRGWLKLERSLAPLLPVEALLSLAPNPSWVDSGLDERFTILLLGSDARHGSIGLTDTIIIASIKNGVVSLASIPRDTARIPKPGGGLFTGRVNAILKKLKVGHTTAQALDQFELVIENLMQIEIDAHVMIKFNGFTTLVDEVDPIFVNSRRQVRDTRFADDPKKLAGVYFPADSFYSIYAFQPNTASGLCNGLWRNVNSSTIPAQYWCQRAIPFVRSRKGSGNSDFVRALRQQDLVLGAVKRVINRGAGGALDSLRNRAWSQIFKGQLYSDIPPTAANALQLYYMLNGSWSVGFQAVFKPTKYSTHIPGTTAYQLNLSVVRAAAAQWFK